MTARAMKFNSTSDTEERSNRVYRRTTLGHPRHPLIHHAETASTVQRHRSSKWKQTKEREDWKQWTGLWQTWRNTVSTSFLRWTRPQGSHCWCCPRHIFNSCPLLRSCPPSQKYGLRRSRYLIYATAARPTSCLRPCQKPWRIWSWSWQLKASCIQAGRTVRASISGTWPGSVLAPPPQTSAQAIIIVKKKKSALEERVFEGMVQVH